MHKIKNLWKFELNIDHRSCEITMKEKLPLYCHTKLYAFRCLISRPQIRGKLLLSRKPRHFRGSRFSQCFIYYQQLPITRYQVRFDANNYFEQLPIVSTAFKNTDRYVVTGIPSQCTPTETLFFQMDLPRWYRRGLVWVIMTSWRRQSSVAFPG